MQCCSSSWPAQLSCQSLSSTPSIQCLHCRHSIRPKQQCSWPAATSSAAPDGALTAEGSSPSQGPWGQAGHAAHAETGSQQPQPSDRPPTPAQLARWLGLITDAQREVAGSAFFAGLSRILASAQAHYGHGPAQPLLSGITHLVIWGLGSLDSSLVHIRYQLALAKLLRGLLGPPGEVGAEAFDPVFGGLDRAVLKECSIQVSPHNVQGRYMASSPTLFYLPHCELDLTTQLLSANVEAGTLCNVVVLGNSFAQYLERWELKGGGGAKAKPGTAKAGVGAVTAAAASVAGAVMKPPQVQQQQEREGEASGAAAAGGSSLSGLPARCGNSGASDAALAAAEGLLYDLCLCGAVREVAVGERGFSVASAFNDMALHIFEPDWRERLAAQRGLA